jgi:hypothetical protein
MQSSLLDLKHRRQLHADHQKICTRARSTTIHLRVQFANHHWRNRAPNVIALQQHLSTPARADHLVPYLVESRRRISPQHHYRKQTDNSSLHPSPESKAKHDEPFEVT